MMKNIFLLKPYFNLIGTKLTNHDVYNRIISCSPKFNNKQSLDTYFEFTGTQARFLDDRNESIREHGAKAVSKVCEANQIDITDIDCIIFCGLSRHYYEPSTAALIAKELKLYDVPTFDISAACTGMSLGVQIAYQQMALNNDLKNIALVSVELPFKGIDWSLKNEQDLDKKGAAFTISAASSALLLSRKQMEISIRLSGFTSHFDNSYADICHTKIGSYFYSESTKLLRPSLIAIKKLHNELKSVFKDNYEHCWVSPHQPALNPVKSLFKLLKLKDKQIVCNHDKYGNTASCAWVGAYYDLLNDDAYNIKSGDPFAVFTAAGGFASINFYGTFEK